MTNLINAAHEGQTITLIAYGGNATIRHGTAQNSGNIYLSGGVDFPMQHFQAITLTKMTGPFNWLWLEVSRRT